METKFTPGPWKRESDDERCIRGGDGGVICHLSYLRGRYVLDGRRDDAEVIANGRIIAAAPELYETAQAVLQYYDRGDPDDLDFGRGLAASGLIAPLREALAKACGESS